MNPFKDLMIIVEDKPMKLNVIGLMKVGEDEVLIVSDVPALEIGPREYEIFHLIRDGESMSIKDIESDELYQRLCNIWEERIREDKSNDS